MTPSHINSLGREDVISVFSRGQDSEKPRFLLPSGRGSGGRSGEVDSLLDALKYAVEEGDSRALERLLAEDVCAFFSGGDTPVRGRDAVLATWTRHFERWCDVRIERRDTVAETRENLAWSQFLWDGDGRIGAQRYRLEGERWTVVLRCENGCWRFVQMHSSMPYRDWEVHRVE